VTSPNTCGQRYDYTLPSTYSGRTLQLRVRGIFVTPGVEFEVDGVQFFNTPL
jgi:hypothetical protein